jgi:hypothetical protein
MRHPVEQELVVSRLGTENEAPIQLPREPDVRGVGDQGMRDRIAHPPRLSMVKGCFGHSGVSRNEAGGCDAGYINEEQVRFGAISPLLEASATAITGHRA